MEREGPNGLGNPSQSAHSAMPISLPCSKKYITHVGCYAKDQQAQGVTPFDFIACGQSNERKGDSMYPKTFCKMTHLMDAEAASPLIVGQIV